MVIAGGWVRRKQPAGIGGGDGWQPLEVGSRCRWLEQFAKAPFVKWNTTILSAVPSLRHVPAGCFLWRFGVCTCFSDKNAKSKDVEM